MYDGNKIFGEKLKIENQKMLSLRILIPIFAFVILK